MGERKRERGRWRKVTGSERMVTHKLHLHDNKMDGSCITTPSEAVNMKCPAHSPLCAPTSSFYSPKERCGRTYYWILNGGGIYCYCLGATLKPNRSETVASSPAKPHHSSQTQSQFPFNQEDERGGRGGGITGLLPLHSI